MAEGRTTAEERAAVDRMSEKEFEFAATRRGLRIVKPTPPAYELIKYLRAVDGNRGRQEDFLKIMLDEADPGMSRVGRDIGEIRTALDTRTKHVLTLFGHDELGAFEGWAIEAYANMTRWPLKPKRVACYPLRGADCNFAHVEVTDDQGISHPSFVTPTFAGPDHALLLANVASYLLGGI